MRKALPLIASAAASCGLGRRTMREAWSVLLAASLSSACGAAWSPTRAESPNELHVVAETARMAGLHQVKVKGVVTDDAYLVPYGQYGCDIKEGCTAFGWYNAGKAYFYRPKVNQTTLDDLTNAASHEVCHAKHRQHDMNHWLCMGKYASPTYPAPASGWVQVECF